MLALDVSGESPEKVTLTLTWDDLDWMHEVLSDHAETFNAGKSPYNSLLKQLKQFLDESASAFN